MLSLPLVTSLVRMPPPPPVLIPLVPLFVPLPVLIMIRLVLLVTSPMSVQPQILLETVLLVIPMVA